MTEQDTDYIPVEDVAALLGVKTRQAHRYGEGPDARIRTKMVGRRKLFHRGDTEALMQERQAAISRHPKPRQAGLIPVEQVLDYIRERDDHLNELVREREKAGLVPVREMLSHIGERDNCLDEITRRYETTVAYVGYLLGLLEQRPRLEDIDKRQQENAQLKAENAQLKAELERLRRP